MTGRRGFLAALVGFGAMTAVSAGGLTITVSSLQAETAAMIVEDAYLRSSTPSSKTGAAFMVLTNQTGQDDRLIGARSDLDGKIELHTHTQDAEGVMRMTEIEGGVPLGAGESHVFKRAGDHLMFMGLTAPLTQDQEVPITLIFEKSGEVEVVIPVDHERKADHGTMGN